MTHLSKGRTAGKQRHASHGKTTIQQMPLFHLIRLLKTFCGKGGDCSDKHHMQMLEAAVMAPQIGCNTDADCALEGLEDPCVRAVCHGGKCGRVRLHTPECELIAEHLVGRDGVVITDECSSTAECNDWNMCTIDKCTENKCQYSYVPDCNCRDLDYFICHETKSCVESCDECDIYTSYNRNAHCVEPSKEACTALGKVYCSSGDKSCVDTCGDCSNKPLLDDYEHVCHKNCPAGTHKCAPTSQCVVSCSAECGDLSSADPNSGNCIPPGTLTAGDCDLFCPFLSECVEDCIRCPGQLLQLGNICVKDLPIGPEEPKPVPGTCLNAPGYWCASTGEWVDSCCGHCHEAVAGDDQTCTCTVTADVISTMAGNPTNRFERFVASFVENFGRDSLPMCDYTVFQPPDNAWEVLNPFVLDEIHHRPSFLSMLVRTHIIRGMFSADELVAKKRVFNVLDYPLQQCLEFNKWDNSIQIAGHYWYQHDYEHYNIALLDQDSAGYYKESRVYYISDALMPAWCNEWKDNYNYVPGAHNPVDIGDRTFTCSPLQLCNMCAFPSGYCHSQVGRCVADSFHLAGNGYNTYNHYSDTEFQFIPSDLPTCSSKFSFRHFWPLTDRWDGADLIGDADMRSTGNARYSKNGAAMEITKGNLWTDGVNFPSPYYGVTAAVERLKGQQAEGTLLRAYPSRLENVPHGYIPINIRMKPGQPKVLFGPDTNPVRGQTQETPIDCDYPGDTDTDIPQVPSFEFVELEVHNTWGRKSGNMVDYSPNDAETPVFSAPTYVGYNRWSMGQCVVEPDTCARDPSTWGECEIRAPGSLVAEGREGWMVRDDWTVLIEQDNKLRCLGVYTMPRVPWTDPNWPLKFVIFETMHSGYTQVWPSWASSIYRD
eukprot:TRINITY_DN66435_c1_g4_i1.p1 TRINITY_DN66435_c1_g4~~TRINITY_DN66435_c1_g4_i1.p1  ORF type:complete len:968 (-),score=80.37 TRINITY_DN66435_c1_g4_i1:3054-5702(-)